jgi:hypothetical protein
MAAVTQMLFPSFKFCSFCHVSPHYHHLVTSLILSPSLVFSFLSHPTYLHHIHPIHPAPTRTQLAPIFPDLPAHVLSPLLSAANAQCTFALRSRAVRLLAEASRVTDFEKVRACVCAFSFTPFKNDVKCMVCLEFGLSLAEHVF